MHGNIDEKIEMHTMKIDYKNHVIWLSTSRRCLRAEVALTGQLTGLLLRSAGAEVRRSAHAPQASGSTS